jgi:hypothetical protein
MAAENEYLKALAGKLAQSIAQLNDDEEADSDEQKREVLNLLQDIMNYENLEREKCGIGARFNVIHSQLQNLCNTYAKESTETFPEIREEILIKERVQADEEVVYVYLFNAQGRNLNSWSPLLTPRALMDLSANRPVYAKREHVEELLRSKADPEQHAYISAIVKKADIVMSYENSVLKDNIGNLLIRIKYGALHQENILGFHFKNKEYQLSKNAGLILQE